MTVTLRRISLIGTYGNGNNISNILEAEATLGVDQRYSTATFTTAVPVSGLDYNNVVRLTMGVLRGNVVARFEGLLKHRTFSYKPRGIKYTCYGYLSIAAQYENTDDPTAIGGLIPMDLIGSPTGTASQIISAALGVGGVPHNSGNIDSSGIQYGNYEDAFIWTNGENSQNFDLREAGESLLSYIERYDEIDTDGVRRFRTIETLPDSGGVIRAAMTIPPSGSSDLNFTETVDILDGSFDRSIEDTRNYFVVTGYDVGAGAGPEAYALGPLNNSFQHPPNKYTVHLNNPMIERATDNQQGPGQSCQTVANALSAEFNREITKGWIETFRDDPVGPLQVHLISGNGGIVDRLGIGQLGIVQRVTCSVTSRGFRQRFDYLA